MHRGRECKALNGLLVYLLPLDAEASPLIQCYIKQHCHHERQQNHETQYRTDYCLKSQSLSQSVCQASRWAQNYFLKRSFHSALMFNQSECSETCGLLLYKDLHHNETDQENLKDRRRKIKSLDFNGNPPFFISFFMSWLVQMRVWFGKSVTSHVLSWIR